MAQKWPQNGRSVSLAKYTQNEKNTFFSLKNRLFAIFVISLVFCHVFFRLKTFPKKKAVKVVQKIYTRLYSKLLKSGQKTVTFRSFL